MTRSAPSTADQDLMRYTAAHGHLVSAAQLERWRRRGLLPRPTIERLGNRGTRCAYPAGTEQLVASLARHTKNCRRVADLALLAFFDGAPVPPAAVKHALIVTYFPNKFATEETLMALQEAVPEAFRGELSADYNRAEAPALHDLEEEQEAVARMRVNLRRHPGLAQASRDELDQRIVGALAGLYLPKPPVRDASWLADLSAALDLDGSAASRQVWMVASIIHSEQMAVREETNLEERIQRILELSEQELAALREEVQEMTDCIAIIASGGRLTHLAVTTPAQARRAATTLAEWTTARTVHPPGARLAQVMLIEGLRSLRTLCRTGTWLAPSPAGEGRAAFIARTTPS